jgi:hypothetical protein
MTALSFSVDKSVEIQVDARIKIIVPPAAGQVIVTSKIGGITQSQSGAQKIMYTLPADKTVQLGISYVDANGNPAAIDGVIVWSSSNPEIADITSLPVQQGAEGSVVQLTPGTAVGNCQITAQADADMGEGTRHINTLLDVTVVGGEAVAGTITPVGEPTPKP